MSDSNIVVRTAATDADLQLILDLQLVNHRSHYKSADGFVTVRHSMDVLRSMNSLSPHIIALAPQGALAGYALSMLPAFAVQVPILTPMFKLFDSLSLRHRLVSLYRYLVMGQVCVAEAFRGSGVFSQMYEYQADYYRGEYDLILTEVSTSNPRSMRAHLKCGFEIIHTYTDITDEWHVVARPLSMHSN